MKITIVNEQDEIIGYKDRDEATPQDIRRIVALYVFNEKGETLIAKRQFIKKINPNKWGPSVAGHVDEGDDYDSTVLKEAEEEIGLINTQPVFLKKIFYETADARRFASVYYVTINEEEVTFTLQKEEVAEVKWISFSDLETWFTKSPHDFVPSFKWLLDNLKEIYENKN